MPADADTKAWIGPGRRSSLVRCRKGRFALCCRRTGRNPDHRATPTRPRRTTSSGPAALQLSLTSDSAHTQSVPERISDIGIQRELGALPGWVRRGDSLTKTFRFATFPAGISFVTRVADLAESMDHHPDIDIRHTRLTFTLSTHDAGGITTNDLRLAREIERLAVECGGLGTRD